VSAAFIGPTEAVFDTRTQACERIDVPDIAARAFRDYRNMVHLVAAHYVARAMVGPTLDTVKRNCGVIYHSLEDPDPSHYQAQGWLAAFYTTDGRRIAALLHNEYHAWNIPGQCRTPNAGWPGLGNCWLSAVTFALSDDGGYSFTAPPSPKNLLAAMPYVYDKENREGRVGYTAPTNILKVGEFFYTMINNWPHRAQKYGPCVLRTNDVFDPSSWRAWDGAAFTIRFINPYVERNAKPEEHVCAPVLTSDLGGVVVHQGTGHFVATTIVRNRTYGEPGLYLLASADLIHWSKPTLVASTAAMAAAEEPGKWAYHYASLIDPASTDRDFGTVSDNPYIYYVRLDLSRGNFTRVLFRHRLSLRVRG
jgi:hypothetical protein